MYLMCKNTKVMNLDTGEVLAPNLGVKVALPTWLRNRYSSNTNVSARCVRSKVFKQGNRALIDVVTRAFSLSDCYWITDDPSLLFESLSPYYNDFWKGVGAYSGQAVPTLYVDGYLSKEWINSTTLRKYHKKADIEHAALELARALRINVCASSVGEGYIDVVNFTSPNMMFESAMQSGKIDPEYFTDADILQEFGTDGAKMLIIDAITGNGDRHAGNFGFLRSPDSGQYWGMAPLFDFDHALDANGVDDVLIDSTRSLPKYLVRQLCELALSVDTLPIFTMRTKKILALSHI